MANPIQDHTDREEPTDPNSQRSLVRALDDVIAERDQAREDFQILCQVFNVDPLIAAGMVTGWKQLHGKKTI